MKKVNLQHFAMVIDLTEKLSSEKPAIKIHDRLFEVNNGFKTMLEVDSLLKKSATISQMDLIIKFFEAVFSKEDAAFIVEQNYPIKFYKEIFASVLDLIKGDEAEGK